ncbi:MAG: diguanylate cyclase [Syntrophales bacterium]|jgi:diguanylate cyclase (GGDEF)-like protein/PAS domain S-box-containing protein|nr:diguanylate cyclase [Syntrophales bacterium]
MQDPSKKNKELIAEISVLKQRIQNLEQLVLDHKKAEENMRESEAKYRLAFESTSDGIFTIDCNYNISNIAPSIERQLGYKVKEVINRPIQDLNILTSESLTRAVSDVIQVLSGVEVTGAVYEFIAKDGTRKIGEVTGTPIIREGRILGVTAIVRDVTERKRIEEELKSSETRYRELSIIDDLTQLYNSRHFYRQLKMEIDRVTRYEEQPMTLLLLDLDDFKQFNDAYGHVEGDQVLSQLGQVVKRCLRQTDSAYRYGGEEFTILLPMTTSKDAAVTAERIRTEFKKETFSPTPGKDVHVTVSIGLGQYKPQEDMKAFVHRVDQLMYQAKKNGKDMIYSEL